MPQKVKIIHILPILPHPVIKSIKNPYDYFTQDNLGSFVEIKQHPYWVGFFEGDHHVTGAKHVLEKTKDFDVECWRPYGNGINKMYINTNNNVTHKVFPAFKVTVPHLGSIVWSNSMFNELKKEIKKNKIILNVSVGHVWSHIVLFYLLSPFKSKFAMVAKHRSGQFKIFSFRQLATWKKFFKWYYLFEYKIDVESLKKLDTYFTHSLYELNYIKNKYPDINVKYHRAGVDFNKFIPASKLVKEKLRKKLGLPLEKKILLAQGNFRSDDYGYDKLIQCYKELTEEGSCTDLQLVIIGGYKHEDLYNVGIEAGVIMVERKDTDTFYDYIRASDFFTKAFFSEVVIKFGGIGTSTIEALAFGIPVISNNLLHFPGKKDELSKIGLPMQTNEELKKNIVFLKNNLAEFSECRSIAKKYYDLEVSNEIIINEYRCLSSKYFGPTKANNCS
jgi:glycosyltransferase involved in cell wall biosynthesis